MGRVNWSRVRPWGLVDLSRQRIPCSSSSRLFQEKKRSVEKKRTNRGASRGIVCVPFAFETGAPLSASCSSDKAARLASPNRHYVPRANAQHGVGKSSILWTVAKPPKRKSRRQVVSVPKMLSHRVRVTFILENLNISNSSFFFISSLDTSWFWKLKFPRCNDSMKLATCSLLLFYWTWNIKVRWWNVKISWIFVV